MVAFKVSLNGKNVCIAGVRGLGVLSAIATWMRRRPERAGDTEKALLLEVAGLDSDAKEHLKWLRRGLRIGDRVAIEILESPRVDTPKRRHRDDPAVVGRAKRRYFERLKKEYARKTKGQRHRRAKR